MENVYNDYDKKLEKYIEMINEFDINTNRELLIKGLCWIDEFEYMDLYDDNPEEYNKKDEKTLQKNKNKVKKLNEEEVLNELINVIMDENNSCFLFDEIDKKFNEISEKLLDIFNEMSLNDYELLKELVNDYNMEYIKNTLTDREVIGEFNSYMEE